MTTNNVTQQNFEATNTYTVATGTNSILPLVFGAFNPTPQLINYKQGQLFVNTLTDEMWVLDGFASIGGVVTANWSKTGSGSLGLETLTGNTGGAVGVDSNHNINTIGTSPYTVTGNPSTHTLTWADNGTIAYTYTENTGTATPAANNLNVLGDATQGIATSGSGSTITITADDATTTQKGVTLLATNAQAIAGSLSDNHAINPASLGAKLGAQTLNGISYGGGTTAAINWMSAGTDGQIPIGSSIGAPAMANITSTGGTISVTNGHNTINLETTTSAGDLILIQSQTASSSSSLIFNTNIGSYAAYLIVYQKIVPDTTGFRLVMQVSSDGGSTWITSGNTSPVWFNRMDNGNVIFDTSHVGDYFILTGRMFNTGFGSGEVWYITQSASLSGTSIHLDNVQNTGCAMRPQGYLTPIAIANAFKFFIDDSHIITSGTISLYGLRT